MSDELTRMLELPAAARLITADGELAIITLTHEHADKLVVERRRLGASIDVGDLLTIIGGHGLADLPRSQIRVAEIAAPQLPAPIAAPDAPVPTTRRTTKHQRAVVCSRCSRTFANAHALDVHAGRAHKEPPPVPPPPPQEPAPAAALGHQPAAPQLASPPIAVAPSVEGICDVCRVSVRFHERCADCTALLGSGHAAGPIHITANGKDLCESCFSYRGAARSLLGVPA